MCSVLLQLRLMSNRKLFVIHGGEKIDEFRITEFKIEEENCFLPWNAVTFIVMMSPRQFPVYIEIVNTNKIFF